MFKERRSQSRVTPAQSVEEAVPWMVGTLPDDVPDQEQPLTDDQRAYEAGVQEGIERGIKKGVELANAEFAAQEQALKTAREQCSLSAQRMADLVARFESEFSRIESALAQKMLETSIGLAEKVIACEIETNKDILVSVISQSLASVGAVREHMTVIVNPSDLPVIREAIDGAGVMEFSQIRTDPSIEPGGCHIESTCLQIDASLQTRWQRALKSIGQTSDQAGLDDSDDLAETDNGS